MITYIPGAWSLGLALQRRGSVVPKAIALATPFSLAAAGINFLGGKHWHTIDAEGLDKSLSGLSITLGFLIVFRTGVAYRRFWDGASFLLTIRAGWFNVCSSCFAFCSQAAEKKEEVKSFQHQLARLISFLYCCALEELSGMSMPDFEVLDLEGMDKCSLAFIEEKKEKCEIVLQWVQRLIVENHARGVLEIAPPILSRVFQELANGIIDAGNARSIKTVPFPFPYAQTISLMLLVHSICTTLVAGLSMGNWMTAGLYTLTIVVAFWAINFIATEIEMPYGEDANDLPLHDFMNSMNSSLSNLMHPCSQSAPRFNIGEARGGEQVTARWVWKSTGSNCTWVSEGVMSVHMSETEELSVHAPQSHVPQTFQATIEMPEDTCIDEQESGGSDGVQAAGKTIEDTCNDKQQSAGSGTGQSLGKAFHDTCMEIQEAAGSGGMIDVRSCHIDTELTALVGIGREQHNQMKALLDSVFGLDERVEMAAARIEKQLLQLNGHFATRSLPACGHEFCDDSEVPAVQLPAPRPTHGCASQPRPPVREESSLLRHAILP